MCKFRREKTKEKPKGRKRRRKFRPVEINGFDFACRNHGGNSDWGREESVGDWERNGSRL